MPEKTIKIENKDSLKVFNHPSEIFVLLNCWTMTSRKRNNIHETNKFFASLIIVEK